MTPQAWQDGVEPALIRLLHNLGGMPAGVEEVRIQISGDGQLTFCYHLDAPPSPWVQAGTELERIRVQLRRLADELMARPFSEASTLGNVVKAEVRLLRDLADQVTANVLEVARGK